MHQEANQCRQKKQAVSYNARADKEKDILKDGEKVRSGRDYPKIWDSGTIFCRPNATREPRTYVVERDNKLYRRTREHKRPRHTSTTPLTTGHQTTYGPQRLLSETITPTQVVKNSRIDATDKDNEPPGDSKVFPIFSLSN